jgi:glutathione synthase/RimK-type ligase-like ATP-grasp enzyme
MLLIVTNKADLAVDYLILRLEERGIPFFRLNTEDFLSEYTITIRLDGRHFEGTIHSVHHGDIRVRDIHGAYFRQPVAPDLDDLITQRHRAFANREVLEVLRSLWRLIDESVWLNDPRRLLLANNKALQLSQAAGLGFLIPQTLITVCPESVREFADVYGSHIIGKAVKHGFYRSEDKVLLAFTQRLDESFYDNMAEFCKVPMIYQPEIRKQYDVRVTVVGDSVFPTAIYSQEHTATSVDWRTWDILTDCDLRHGAITLPSDIAAKCASLTKSFGLRYSAIDMVYSTDGNYYFLEMNPNGQWAWIEGKVGYPIRDAILKELGYGSA